MKFLSTFLLLFTCIPLWAQQTQQPTFYQELIINEIFADPNAKGLTPDSLALPSDSKNEFIELFNLSDSAIQLEGMTLNGGTIQAFLLHAGEYVILCATRDTTLFASFGNVVGVTSWNTLSNGGELLQLKDASGTQIDSLHYHAEWYQNSDKNRGGWSLERINPYPHCNHAQNWTASESKIGASPGIINSVHNAQPDTEAPTVDSLIISPPFLLTLMFSESLDYDALKVEMFQLLGNKLPDSITCTPPYTKVSLHFKDSLPANRNNNLTIQQVQDCNGNLIDPVHLSFFIDQQPPVLHGYRIKDWSEIEIAFSEQLSKETLLNADDFLLLPNSIAPQAVSFSHDSSLVLSFSEDFQEGANYQLLIPELEDQYHNASEKIKLEFTFENAIDSWQILDAKLFQITFKEIPTDPLNATNYLYTEENRSPVLVIGNPKEPLEYLLMFEEGFKENKWQHLKVEGLRNAAGKPLTLPSIPFYYDTKAPRINDLSIISKTQLKLYSDEPLEVKNAESVWHYESESLGFPINAQWQASDSSVLLTYLYEFGDEQNHTLKINHLKDLSGNEQSRNTYLDFQYDSLPPMVDKLTVFSLHELELQFSEPIATIDLSPALFRIFPGDFSPDSLYRDAFNFQKLRLFFNQKFDESDTLQLELHSISDQSGNKTDTLQVNFQSLYPSLAELEVRSPQILQLTFSKDLSEVDKSFFRLSNGLYPYKTEHKEANPAVIYLYFKDEFIENTSYTLEIEKLSDTNGHRMPEKLFPSFEYNSGLKQLKISKKNTIELLFEATITPVTAENVDNYLISPGNLKPLAALSDENDKEVVRLWFSTPFENSKNYQLYVDNLKTEENEPLPQSVHPFSPDQTPPEVAELKAYLKYVWITFKENIDQKTLEIGPHFLLNDSLLPIAIEASGRSVLLTYPQPFELQYEYKLYLTGIEDLSGNQINSDTLIFTYSAHTPTFRDIVINEVFATPQQGLTSPQAEFIELLNVSSHCLNLMEMQLSDDTKEVSLPFYTLEPGQHLVLCSNRNTEEFSIHGPVLGVDNFITLNNEGETLSLMNFSGELVDQVLYSKAMFDDPAKATAGYSLELINPYATCFTTENWIESPAQATPGSQNAAFSNKADTLAPFVEHIEIIDSKRMRIDWNETIDTTSFQRSQLLVEELTIKHFAFKATDQLWIYFEEDIPESTPFELVIKPVSDCQGNTVQQINLPFSKKKEPGFLHLLLTEIMADPPENGILPQSEYLEIYNPTQEDFSLKTLLLSTETSRAKLPDQSISAGEYVILCDQEDVKDFQKFGETIGLDSWPSLRNDGTHLQLINTTGNLIFETSYSKEWYQNTEKSKGGWSLEMIDPSNPCAEASNWTASRSYKQGTPGMPNSIDESNPDLTGPALKEVIAIGPQLLKISFDEKIYFTSDTPSEYFKLDNGPTILKVWSDTLNRKIIYASTQAPLDSTSTYQLEVKQTLSDCRGNHVQPVENIYSFRLPVQAKALDVVINEILFNPLSGGVRFIEFYNATNNFIDLKNWSVMHQNETGANSVQLISTEHTVLPPGEFLVITTDPGLLKDQYPKSVVEKIRRIKEMPAMYDEGGVLSINDQSQNIIDQSVYSEALHHELIKETEGVSLERVDPNMPSEQKENWRSASQEAGYATPGFLNSQFRKPKAQETESVIVFPKVLSSPEKPVHIQYKFTNSDYIAKVSIYDMNGKLIRRLRENQLLMQKGFLSWDGRNEANKLVSTGYYLIHFIVFDTYGNTKVFKNKVAVSFRR